MISGFGSILDFDIWVLIELNFFKRYVLAAAILSSLYTLVQTLRHVHEMSTGRQILEKRTSAIVDFAGDQVSFHLSSDL